MTNFERYKDEILKIIKSSVYCQVAMKDGKPVPCEDVICDSCELDDGSDLGNCVLKLMEWGYEDDGEGRDCGDCKHYDEGDTADPCKHCKRYYLDKFERRLLKTRQSEFLKAYPNARLTDGKVLYIDPCVIDRTYDTKDCTYGFCKLCRERYWKQEVE